MSTILVYSSDPAIRERVMLALGRVPDPALGRVEYVEVGDNKAFLATVDAGGIDLCVLDGEAWPTGGMGLARQLKDELADPPATVLVVGRRDDAWLAKWSRADEVIAHPIDPFELTRVVVGLLTARIARPVETAPPRTGFGLRRP